MDGQWFAWKDGVKVGKVDEPLESVPGALVLRWPVRGHRMRVVVGSPAHFGDIDGWFLLSSGGIYCPSEGGR